MTDNKAIGALRICKFLKTLCGCLFAFFLYPVLFNASDASEIMLLGASFIYGLLIVLFTNLPIHYWFDPVWQKRRSEGKIHAIASTYILSLIGICCIGAEGFLTYFRFENSYSAFGNPSDAEIAISMVIAVLVVLFNIGLAVYSQGLRAELARNHIADEEVAQGVRNDSIRQRTAIIEDVNSLKHISAAIHEANACFEQQKTQAQADAFNEKKNRDLIRMQAKMWREEYKIANSKIMSLISAHLPKIRASKRSSKRFIDDDNIIDITPKSSNKKGPKS